MGLSNFLKNTKINEENVSSTSIVQVEDTPEIKNVNDNHYQLKERRK